MAAILKIIISAGVLFLLLLLYLKYFEKTGIFYPTRDITVVPKDAGLVYEEVSIPSGSETINGWFITTAESAPVILFCHGNGGNMSQRVVLLKLFHDEGCNVFIFDYRGYGKSSGVPSESGFYEDALASYRYLTQRRAIPAQRIILYGESIGSAVAFDLAAKVPVAAVVSQGGFSSAVDMGKMIFPWMPRFLLHSLAGVKFDSLAKIKTMTIPKLIIHSKEDEIVPFALGEKLFHTAASPKEFFVIRGSHNEGVYVYKEEFITRFNEFVAKYYVK